MVKIRNMVSSFAIVFVLIILIVNFWTPFREEYDITETELQDNKNIFEKLSEINLIEGIQRLSDGIFKVTKLSSASDLLGGIALVGTGALQTIGGVITFPIELFGVIAGFYDNVIPPIISQLIGFLTVISVGFILLSAKLGFEL